MVKQRGMAQDGRDHRDRVGDERKVVPSWYRRVLAVLPIPEDLNLEGMGMPVKPLTLARSELRCCVRPGSGAASGSPAGTASLPDCNINGNEAFEGGESSGLGLHAACAALKQL